MPIASPHEAVLTASTTRLAALSLDDVEDRIEQREILDEGWMGGMPVCPLLVVSGVGLRSDLGQPTSCTDDDAYPLLIRIVDRVQSWSAEQRNSHYKWMYTIIQAFRRKPLTLSFSGSHCTNIILLPSVTIEAEPLAFNLISRPIQFEVHTRVTR